MQPSPSPLRRWRLLVVSLLSVAALVATGAAAAAQVDGDEPTTTETPAAPEPTEPETSEPEPTEPEAPELTEPEAPEPTGAPEQPADETEPAGGPADPEAARAEIEAALAEISAGIQEGPGGVEKIVAHIEHGDSIVDVMVPLLDIPGHEGVTLTLEDVEFESPTLARSTTMFRLGAPVWAIDGYWVHDEETWKWRTTRSAACAVMAKYGGLCDPGDDDSPWAGEQPATVTPVLPEGDFEDFDGEVPGPARCEEVVPDDRQGRPTLVAPGEAGGVVCYDSGIDASDAEVHVVE